MKTTIKFIQKKITGRTKTLLADQILEALGQTLALPVLHNLQFCQRKAGFIKTAGQRMAIRQGLPEVLAGGFNLPGSHLHSCNYCLSPHPSITSIVLSC